MDRPSTAASRGKVQPNRGTSRGAKHHAARCCSLQRVQAAWCRASACRSSKNEPTNARPGGQRGRRRGFRRGCPEPRAWDDDARIEHDDARSAFRRARADAVGAIASPQADARQDGNASSLRDICVSRARWKRGEQDCDGARADQARELRCDPVHQRGGRGAPARGGVARRSSRLPADLARGAAERTAPWSARAWRERSFDETSRREWVTSPRARGGGARRSSRLPAYGAAERTAPWPARAWRELPFDETSRQ
jgi:hypothetical protein